MMRFGNFESPVLLEALGDLLNPRGVEEKRLAARAYLKASYETTGLVRDAYRELASHALSMQLVSENDFPTGEYRQGKSGQHELKLNVLEQMLQQELTEAKDWIAGVANDEKSWIRGGFDADAAFQQKYYVEPTLANRRGMFTPPPPETPLSSAEIRRLDEIETPFETVLRIARTPLVACGMAATISLIFLWVGIASHRRKKLAGTRNH